MIELNLLPDIKKEFIKAQKTRNTVVSLSILVSIVAVGIVGIFASVVYIAQNTTIDQLTKEISQSHNELSKKDAINGYLTIQNQLAALDGVVNDRLEYSRLFDFLAQLNPKAPNTIALYSVEVDKVTKSLKIQGEAASFEVVNNFKNTLLTATIKYKVDGVDKEDPLFTQINGSQASLVSSGGKPATSFTFDLAYIDSAFDTRNTDVVVAVPNIITSDSDKNAPVVFTEKSTKEPTDGSQ